MQRSVAMPRSLNRLQSPPMPKHLWRTVAIALIVVGACTDGVSRRTDAASVCGNGKVEAQEECDPAAAGANPFNCSDRCKTQSVYTPCKTNDDCVNGTVCGLELCTRACEGPSDCDQVAEYPDLQLWCPQPRGTQCVIRCDSDADCPPGTACNGGRVCQGPEASSPTEAME